MEKLGVIGTGTMGHSIALNAAWKNVNVVIHGVGKTEIEHAMYNIQSKLTVLQENGLIDAMIVSKILDSIQTTTRIEDVARNSSFIIEAIPEEVHLKQKLFSQLDQICADNIIFASNTSGIDPDDIASAIQQPERFVVTHFWNPAHLIPLVEIVPCTYTSEHTMARAKILLQKMNKKTIELKKSIPGFIGNRLQYALFREAQFLLEEGIASKEDIDAVVTYSIGRRLPVTGPFLSADMGGLDVFAAISNYLFKDLSNADHALPTLQKLVAEDNLGVKSGKGYYEWDKVFSAAMIRERESELIRFLKKDIGSRAVAVK
ncbi:MAG: hypothetical protein JNK79_17230 [Chitinophagaceae bacterium]|nr:hypothetical protein [Chitinophagaceae bacterium]